MVPNAATLPPLKPPTKKTVVVLARLNRKGAIDRLPGMPLLTITRPPALPSAFGNVAETRLTPALKLLDDPPPASLKLTWPATFQSPAVRETLVTFASTPGVKTTANPVTKVEERNSPMFPAVALSLPPVAGICPCAHVAPITIQ